jgi:DNA-binding HxlR family transcriptional regulator
MPKNGLENFKELLELIPQVMDAGKLGLDREVGEKPHSADVMQEELTFYHSTTEIIQGKWAVDILYILFRFKSPNYNNIKRALLGLNSRSLTDRLKKFEESKILTRHVQDTRPITVTYELTEFGKNLIYLLMPAVLYCRWPESIR